MKAAGQRINRYIARAFTGWAAKLATNRWRRHVRTLEEERAAKRKEHEGAQQLQKALDDARGALHSAHHHTAGQQKDNEMLWAALEDVKTQLEEQRVLAERQVLQSKRHWQRLVGDDLFEDGTDLVGPDTPHTQVL